MVATPRIPGAVAMSSTPARGTPGRSDFDVDVHRIDRAIAEIEPRTRVRPTHAEPMTRYCYLLYQRASLGGHLQAFDVASAAIERAIVDLGPAPDLYLLKANLDFTFHRLPDAKRDLITGRGLLDTPHGRALWADLDFQEGRYADAQRGYAAVIRDEPTWDNLARLAFLTWKLGDTPEADRLYLQAQDQLTAKEMRAYAWVELQRGVLDLRHGRYGAAAAHYDRADRAYSGYWLVEEHKAELLGARGRFHDAAQLYHRVIERVPRPEFQQALAELYTALGRADLAAAWSDRALAGYLEAARRGGVHYYHHLADFYSDVRPNGHEALAWARKDLALRRNFSTLSALAWAAYRAGELPEAVDALESALASGARDAHLYSHAATIYQAAGASGESARYRQAAAELNRDHGAFHVHR